MGNYFNNCCSPLLDSDKKYMTRITELSALILILLGLGFFVDIGLQTSQYESLDWFLDILISMDGWMPVETIFSCVSFLLSVILGIATYAIFKFAVGD